MDKCLGCLSILFARKHKKQRLKYLVNYKDGGSQENGIEFDNLMLDNDDLPNYGTEVLAIGREEREYLAKQQYDKIIEDQRKIDKQIDNKLFEEDFLQVEEETYVAAQEEAARASARTVLSKEKCSVAGRSIDSSPSSHNLTLEEVEDDFENFLEEVRSRSIAFRRQYASKRDDNMLSPDRAAHRGADGQSSEDDFVATENSSALNHQQKEHIEWDSYTSGLIGDLPKDLSDGISLEKRLEPVGVGCTKEVYRNISKPTATRNSSALSYHKDIDRIFSITDDEEDMGDFVRA